MDWQAIEQQVKKSIELHALRPLSLHEQTRVDENIDFTCFIKHTENASLKTELPKNTNSNPFLPHDDALFIEWLGASHKVLLNKFPALENHILLCSNEFIAQTSPLTLSDFEAWLTLLQLHDSIGFYNGGAQAGASQAHRHMQVFKSRHNNIAQIATKLGEQVFYHSGNLTAQTAYDLYLDCINLTEQQQSPEPYNLIVTSQQFMFIKRAKAEYKGIAANGLNFCGYFLVNDLAALETLSRFGFIAFLKQLISN